MSAQVISPVAISPAPTGVATIASYVCEYLYLMKKLNVVSSSAPFMAADASNPGATNCLYDTISPPTLIDPTRLPTPTPIDRRNSSGSRNPDRKMYQVRRYA